MYWVLEPLYIEATIGVVACVESSSPHFAMNDDIIRTTRARWSFIRDDGASLHRHGHKGHPSNSHQLCL